MKKEQSELAKALIKEVQEVISNLPGDIVLTSMEVSQYSGLKVETVSFRVRIGANRDISVRFDRNLGEGA